MNRKVTRVIAAREAFVKAIEHGFIESSYWYKARK